MLSKPALPVHRLFTFIQVQRPDMPLLMALLDGVAGVQAVSCHVLGQPAFTPCQEAFFARYFAGWVKRNHPHSQPRVIALLSVMQYTDQPAGGLLYVCDRFGNDLKLYEAPLPYTNINALQERTHDHVPPILAHVANWFREQKHHRSQDHVVSRN